MKYFLVLLAVTAVFAQQPLDTSIEDNQLEVDKTFDEIQQEVDTPFGDNKQEADKSTEDNQEDLDLESLTDDEDDDSNQQAVIPASANLCSINVRALTTLINCVISKKLASQPVVQMLYLSIGAGSRVLTIQKMKGGSFRLGPVLSRITIGNGVTSKTSSILAYRPRYNGYHNTKYGAVFLNLEKLFPCAGKHGLVPVCRRFTQEEDGFYRGRSILESADHGNSMRIFGTNIKTYGFVFQGCYYLNGRYGCLPNWFQTVVTCFLPRACL